MDDVLADFGDFCFSLFITYVGALEFLIILRHLVHWSGRHEPGDEDDAQNLLRLREKLRQQLEAAKERELKANANVMRDGVAYSDGFRKDVAQKDIESLKAEILNIEARIKRRAEMEAELALQRRIRDETKKQLERAEAALVLQREKEAEEEKRKEQAISEEAENLRRLLAAEKQREAEEKQREADEENLRKTLAAERQREEEQRRMEENEAAERQKQETIANEENSRKLLEAERAHEAKLAKEEQEAAEAEAAQRLQPEALASAESNFANEEADNLRKLLEAEREREAKQAREEKEAEEAHSSQSGAEKFAESTADMLTTESANESLQTEAQESAESTPEILTTDSANESLQTEAQESAESTPEILTTDSANEGAQQEYSEYFEDAEKYGSNLSQKLFQAEKLRQSMEDDEELYSDDEALESSAVQVPRKKERKQKLIEENARKFLEAEEEMVQKMLESAQQAEPMTPEPVVEEPIVKRTQPHVASGRPPNEGGVTTTVKTQFGQGSNESFTLSTKPLLFPGISDDASSNEPNSSKQSSFSTQPSEELTAGIGNEDIIRTVITTTLMTPQQERQDPDGEDNNTPTLQYDEEYLRSLDGIKHRPLMREDGSGRRRAFKKRRSSGSSNSSRDSRTSREEELRMFTSLEEEELKSSHSGEPNFTPIKYTSEPTLKVKGHHHRRHKRSPAKDARMQDEIQRTSLEMLGEENSNPWGEVVPEHYKNTEFWRREKAMSIDEEEIEFEMPIAGKEAVPDKANNKINSSSFEEATHEQNEAAMSAMTQLPKEADPEASQVEGASGDDNNKSDNNDRTNLQTSHESEGSASPARSSASPRLRRSPRIDEMDQYEERWKELETHAAEQQATAQNQAQPKTPTTPKINIQAANNEAWRDEYGLIMQGLSDFYDFQASANPSRSRETSRNASPASSQPSSPVPKDVSYNLEKATGNVPTTVFDIYNDTGNGDFDTENMDASLKFDVYDDTGKFENTELADNNIEVLIETLHEDQLIQLNALEACQDIFTNEHPKALQTVADAADERPSLSVENSLPAICIECTATADDELQMEETVKDDMNAFVQSLCNERRRSSSTEEQQLQESQVESREINETASKSAENDTSEEMTLLIESLRVDRRRSRSRSPLPTMDNVERSLEMRRSKRIQQNDELFEKLAEKEEANALSPSLLHSDQRRSLSRSPPPTIEHCSKIDTDAKEEMNELVTSLRPAPRRSRSRSPLPTMDNIERSLETRRNKLIQHNNEVAEKLAVKTEDAQESESQSHKTKAADREEMNSLVASLRVAQTRSRSRSPLPTMENMERSLETRRNKLIQHNDEVFDKCSEKTDVKFESPAIKIEAVEETQITQDDNDFKDKEMCSLVASLRAARSRSRSKSPMPKLSTQDDNEFKDREMSFLVASMRTACSRSRSKSPMPMSKQHSKSPDIFVEYIDESDVNEIIVRTQLEERHNRSRTPSRSPIRSQSPEDLDFHRLLNLESSQNRTLAKESEELESILAAKQRHLDDEALFTLRTAQEETELRILSPTELLSGSNSCEEEAIETNDQLGELPATTAHLQKLRCTPTTPDYERSRSEEWKDVQRMKNEILAGSFKRSTYVGESLELGCEYEQLRREAAKFQRSKSPSPSFSEETLPADNARLSAADRRRIQENILNELITSSSSSATKDDENRNGAKPKQTSMDPQHITREEDGGGSVEDMRREMSRFQRSRSCSRSPMDERATIEVAAIDAEAVKREIQDRILENFSDVATLNFQNFHYFSRHLSANFLDDRRSSDSAMVVQFRENDGTSDFEPEEYHHYRRFSLNQEQPVEEYPEDDYIYVSQIEVQTPTGTRTWLREDYYCESLGSLQIALANDEQNIAAQHAEVHEVYEGLMHDEDETDGSEDERQTVVEVDDEIDTDICDFNERGPTDESHHEQSECEEADRAMDHYAGREAADWQEVSDVSEIFRNNETRNDEEGAVGGTVADPDSFAIDEIYDDAIKNRKQSGILREFDSILQEMQKSYEQNSSRDGISDKERYALWAKTRALERAEGSGGGRKSATVSFIEAEKRDTEIRYLGDANMTARQSTRLRSRYGYVPVLQSNAVEADLNVDLNYKPKREYNWRKNFKLDEDEESENATASAEPNYVVNYVHKNGEYYELGAVGGDDDDGFEERKYSLGGESITLFSRSPDREEFYDEEAVNEALEIKNGVSENLYDDRENKENATPIAEKPKKKKSKKKTLRGSKEQLERKLSKDEDDSDSQMGSRRSSSIQMETDSPKRKSRSRRSSRSSVTTNDDTNSLFSARSSVGFDGALLVDGNSETNLEPAKKKVKKRKKVKESFSKSHDIKEEQEHADVMPIAAPTVSAAITPQSACCNMLAALSPQQSACVTPASTESEKSEKNCHLNEEKANMATTTTTTTATKATTPSTNSGTRSSGNLESFDMLKDASFYPLF